MSILSFLMGILICFVSFIVSQVSLIGTWMDGGLECPKCFCLVVATTGTKGFWGFLDFHHFYVVECFYLYF